MRSLSAADPRVIGPYRLSALLGAGGMGRVYLGTGPDGDTVAVKVVRAEYAYDPSFRERFARELDLVGRVRGDFTPRVLDADPAGTPPWMATEYVAGPTLHDLVRRTGPLPEETVRFLARGLTTALARVHALGTVHRDLKPGNVMVSASGPQVIDFGVAGALEDSGKGEQGGEGGTGREAGNGGGGEERLVAGTPGYMAPEQIDGDEATAATDVFALGGVLAYALTGTGPFGDGHPAAVVFRIAHQEPVLTRVPEGLRDLLTACLARDPADRPTAAQVLAALGGPVAPRSEAGAWLPAAAARRVEEVAEEASGFPATDRLAEGAVAEETTELRAPDRLAEGATVTRRRPLTVAAGAATLVLFTGLAAWAVVEGGENTAGGPGAEGSAAGEEAGPAEGTVCSLPGDLAPEYVEAARSDPKVPGHDTHHLDVHTYPALSFLGDGELLAATHPEGIALWDPASGEEVAYVGADLPEFAWLPFLSPDGCRFGFPSPDGGVHVFDMRTGEHASYVEPLSVQMVAFSPDGGSLAIAEGLSGEGVRTVDLDTGEATTVSTENASWITYSSDGSRLALSDAESVAVVVVATGSGVHDVDDAWLPTLGGSVVLPGDDDGFLYVRGDEEESGLELVDLTTGEAAWQIAVPSEPALDFIAVHAPAGTDRVFALVEVADEEGYHFEVAVWDTSTGEQLLADPRPVRDLAVSPDGGTVAALSADGTTVWTLDPDTLDVLAEFS